MNHNSFAMLLRRSLFGLFISVLAAARLGHAASLKTESHKLASPGKRLSLVFHLDASGSPRYLVELDGVPVLRESKLGLVRDDADFSQGLRFSLQSKPETVSDRYEILTAKRRVNIYKATRQVFHMETASGQKMDLIFQVSDDGVAFRYFFPENSPSVRKLLKESSSYHFLPGTRAWLQPMSVAKSGWCQVNPCYEELYEKDIPTGKPSTFGAGWVYPALFHSGDTWLLVSEGSLPRNYCGTRLASESTDSEYSVGFPDPREVFPGGPANPESQLPWLTPWRFIVVGSLKTIMESTLGIDLADKPTLPVSKGFPGSLGPGKASWSWPLLGDKNTTYDTEKRFIDYAADMHWQYCLIDDLWDTQIGYNKVKELADYARSKGIGILLWYNSAGNWNTTPLTPRDRMLTHDSRIQEFNRLKAMGIAGLKIDFFGGDGQSMIGYYHDILEDAAPYGLLMNFHGPTLPRGWQRTFPRLMTMEAVRGLEYVTFEQKNADEEPTHAATLPFTRNVFDPMDFTPMVLDRVPRIQRRTTSGFELALSVVFTSGIQHYAEIPEGMAKVPPYVKDFLRNVPSVWDDMKFLDGYPGNFVVVARKGNGHWYVAGINGEPVEKRLSLDLAELRIKGAGELITDGGGGNLSFRQAKALPAGAKKLEITLEPCGGFVAVF